MRIVVIGGGASGIFAAIRAAECAKKARKKCQVVVLEASPNFLKKVSISGGGRCNVTHHEFEVSSLVKNYPRGEKSLRNSFHRFGPRDTVQWFVDRGLKLHTEVDGRMFPVTNRSSSVIDVFFKECEKLGVELLTNHNVRGLSKVDDKFILNLHDKEDEVADKIILATGSSPHGYRLAKSLGHKITELAPSLFSFKINSKLLKDLSGISFTSVSLKLKIAETKKSFEQSGPMLITHWGLSGPAILKLSAWAAREMRTSSYKAVLSINFLNSHFEDAVKLVNEGLGCAERQILANWVPSFFTKRFWLQFLEFVDIDSQKVCGELSKKERNRLAESFIHLDLEIDGKNRYKDEFVECGGVELKEIDFKSMESKKCPGLYVTGELLDVDGITGGFNFQNAWASGYIAGAHIFGDSQ